VLTTIRRDGRPQLSNIMFVPKDDQLWISVTDSRAKTKNLRRDPRAALYVPADDFWSYVVLDGPATLTEVAKEPHDQTVDELVDQYRTGFGEHADWDDFRASMVRDGRLLVKLAPTTAYGMIRADG
jgi:PPOX class probable F420-dependent enzyme